METTINVTTERVDDIVLLLKVIIKLNLPVILDRHIPRHWLQEGLSWGWVAAIWLAHILSQGDHRKLTVREWVGQAHKTLEKTTGLNIRDTDFTDDRLTIVLRELSKPEYWHTIERDLGQNTIRVYNLEQKRVRLDATTVSGYHEGGEESLFQFGKSKDNPDLLQIKVMMGTLDPLGLPLVTDVVSGERADDGLYIPSINRILTILSEPGLLFVGDCKMSAIATRWHIHNLGHRYLTPLALVGQAATQMSIWIKDAIEGKQQLIPISRIDAKGEETILGKGYETSRICKIEVNGKTQEWTERVLVVYSQEYGKTMGQALEQRLAAATKALLALTPTVGRGKRQIKEEAQLVEAAQKIIQSYRVEGLLSYTFQQQVESYNKYVGRGRGSSNRQQEIVEKLRYEITSVVRQEIIITELKQTYGWRAYVTDVGAEQLTLQEAVLTYRDEPIIERGFHRLKGVPLSLSPLFVKRDDQVVGLTNLLSIALRLLTLIEFVVRRSLKQQQKQLVGLHKENLKKATDRPTTERLLQAFSNITLTIMEFRDRVIRHITPLTSVQVSILELLGVSSTVYSSLAINST